MDALTLLAISGLAGLAAWSSLRLLQDLRVQAEAQRRLHLTLGKGPDLGAKRPWLALRDLLQTALQSRLPPKLALAQGKLLQQARDPKSPASLTLECLGAGLAGLLLGSWLLPGWPALALWLGATALPVLRLRDLAARRLAALRKGLPDALDLLVSCVEAGLAFDLSMARVAARLKMGPLKEELEMTLSEMRLGRPRREALRRLSQRCELEELGSLVSVLVQADQLGAPLGPVLRAQAGQLRALRSLEAQRRAAQAPIKMLFPLMAFILPVVFLVLFGPLYLKWKSGAF